MDLSRQYFTVLQMLRIASEWVNVSLADWYKMREDIVKFFKFLRACGETTYDQGEPLEEQLDKVTQLLTGQVKQLQNRINTKTEEVKSLRDGVWVICPCCPLMFLKSISFSFASR